MRTTALSETRRARLPVVLGMVVSFPVFALQVGTGGAATVDYFKNRGSRGYALARYELGPDDEDNGAGRTAAEDLAHVRAVLKPAVTDLAKALNVSRQAIYDWQAGKPIAPENAERLADLGRAADVLAREGLTATGILVRRPLRDGKTLFELVRTGESAEEAVLALVAIGRREMRQREMLKERLARRPRPSRDAFDSAGAPMLDEKG